MGQVRRLIPVWMAMISLVSCSLTGEPTDKGVSVRQAYNHSQATKVPPLTIQSQSSPLKEPRNIPVLYPPEVFSVYVPTHVDRKRDIMVGEHWVFFKIKDAEWFQEHRNRAVMRTHGIIPDDEVNLLRRQVDAGMKEIVIPYRKRSR